ncbi:ATP-binding protein [Desulfoluna sp.]|uniref:ATP-binding protein n=1 Tax=Desulfoluna sp. TaxID=2045199 RepID=UPI00262E7A76|nr:ATP-binding protein [Desulfoluna sp.]
MALFEFIDNAHLLGTVREVDTRKVSIHVKSDEDLRKARVGQLVSLQIPGGVETWLIGLIDKVIKSVAITPPTMNSEEVEELELEGASEEVVNTVRLTLVGTARWDAATSRNVFSRSLMQVPEIESRCYVLQDKQLESFMNLLVTAGDTEHSLALGVYAMDDSATAYLDGNRFFQRHAALLGSTGSGKSWTVASILERASKLPTSNLIVFDLHGEYRKLSYARHLRIPGPEELGQSSDNLLYLPYWLLNADEMQAMFIDRSEFSAHNQVMAFQDAVIEEKKAVLQELGKSEVLNAFTLDSPIPFSIDRVVTKLTDLNEEMVQGARGLKQGNFYGQFSRLLTRLRSKLSDKRYGFLFHAPEKAHHYDAMAAMVHQLMDYKSDKAQVKVIDFSEVPSEILPVIVALVARIVYQVQFWTNQETRRPIALVCDEAHLYLPKKEGQNPVERRAIEAFEKIAKEGRKYGVALLIVSQRPSDVSTTVLSQCNNVIALRLTNGDDQSTVKKLMPESLESLLDVLPIMDVGEALVVGDAVLLPSRIKITEPTEKPLSATIDFWSEWQQDADQPDYVRAVENMRRQGRG